MRIITVGYLHGSGGAERQIILLSNLLSQHGHEVTLLVLSDNKSPYNISEKVHVVDLSNKEGKGRVRILRRFFAFYSAVKSICPDVIINYNLQSAYFCLGIPVKIRGKVVYSERGDPYDEEYSGLLGIIRNYTVKRMTGLVFQSEGARDFFPECVKMKSVVIHNSVNVPQEEYPIPIEREKRIVNVGRLHPQKNQKLLIEAFAKISSSKPEYTLDIYGDGVLHNELQDKIDALGLHDRIHLISSRSDIFGCIHEASLFVLTSNYEGMPNALMEAMSLGLPCISTDCRPGGARTLIDNEVNGIITPCNNVDILAKQMIRLLDDRELAESMAHNARLMALTHTEEMVLEKWNTFLNSIIAVR